MVKKLFKHEFKAYARIMVFVYGILMMVATAGRIVQFFEDDGIIYKIISVFSGITYAFTIGAAIMFTMAFSVVRFYKNLFTHEGYLSFTLPVTATQQIWVKTLTAFAFYGITLGTVLLSGCIFTAGELLVEILKAAGYLLELFLRNAPFQTISIGFELLLLFSVIALSEILLYYTFIAIGQLFRKNRILAAVGAYFAYYIGTQFISTTFSVLFSVFAMTPTWYRMTEFILRHPLLTLHSALWFFIIMTGVWVVVCFVIIRKIITKKLNLE